MNLCECGKLFPEECARDCIKTENTALRSLVILLADYEITFEQDDLNDYFSGLCEFCAVLLTTRNLRGANSRFTHKPTCPVILARQWKEKWEKDNQNESI